MSIVLTADAASPNPPKVATTSSTATTSLAAKPNFVVIFTDDQGYGDLSCFGGEHVSTPRIDQMAAEGSQADQLLRGGPSLHALSRGTDDGVLSQTRRHGHGIQLSPCCWPATPRDSIRTKSRSPKC